MRKNLLRIPILVLLYPFLLFAQSDPREYDHSMNILPFQDAGGQKYYLTWASSSGSVDWQWQHDIYKQVIYFDDSGVLNTEVAPDRYIGTGSDEAQEPVDIAFDPDGNIALSVWEDGSGTSVDIRGQLHRLDGTVIRENWIIAGGEESQHSPAVVHVQDRFIVAVTDEAPPARYSMIEARVLNDGDGAEMQSLNLSPTGDDMWWPVAASDGEKYAFIGWGDGENFYGSVLTLQSDSVSSRRQNLYLPNIEQYYYSVVWLENLSRFFAVAKSGNKSLACLIDTTGVMTKFVSLSNAAITRETQLAVRWDDGLQQYNIVFSTGSRNLASLRVAESMIELNELIRGEQHPLLKDIVWPSTGIAGQFVRSISGNDLWIAGKLLLFAFNDRHSNDAVLLPISLAPDTGVKMAAGSMTETSLLSAYPNPFNSAVHISFVLPATSSVDVTVYAMNGQLVRRLIRSELAAGLHHISWDGKDDRGMDVSSGFYICRLLTRGRQQSRGLLLLR